MDTGRIDVLSSEFLGDMANRLPRKVQPLHRVKLHGNGRHLGVGAQELLVRIFEGGIEIRLNDHALGVQSEVIVAAFVLWNPVDVRLDQKLWKMLRGKVGLIQKSVSSITVEQIWRELSRESPTAMTVVQHDFQGLQDRALPRVIVSHEDVYIPVELEMLICKLFEIH
ncbi:hypothetical protein D3C75_463060 [compost metagenome]